MEPTWTSTAAGQHLAGRRKRDTTPEVLLRKALHATGARFRLQRNLARGCTPDLVLPKMRLAVFVDGCFWHSCPQHGRRTPWTGPNAVLWAEKMTRNRASDERSTVTAQNLGWTVVRVWEHDITANASDTAARVLEAFVDKP